MVDIRNMCNQADVQIHSLDSILLFLFFVLIPGVAIYQTG